MSDDTKENSAAEEFDKVFEEMEQLNSAEGLAERIAAAPVISSKAELKVVVGKIEEAIKEAEESGGLMDTIKNGVATLAKIAGLFI